MSDEISSQVLAQSYLEQFLTAEQWSSPSTPSRRVSWPCAALLTVGVGLSSSARDGDVLKRALLPQSSTISKVVPDAQPLRRKLSQAALPSTPEQLHLLQAVFRLNKTNIAKVCRVQRQTIYDWAAAKYPASGENEKRLAALFQVARSLKETGRSLLDTRMASRRLESGSSLLELLSRDSPSALGITTAVDALIGKKLETPIGGARALMEKYRLASPDDERRKLTLEDNLSGVVDG